MFRQINGIVFALLIGMLAACGGGDTGADASTKTDATVEDRASAEDAGTAADAASSDDAATLDDAATAEDANSPSVRLPVVVYGLNAGALTLQLDGAQQLSVSADGIGYFTDLQVGVSFTVSVSNQPNDRFCSVEDYAGVYVDEATSQVSVTCAIRYVVTGTMDTPDIDPGNGLCADSAGECSLRAAIQEALLDNAPSYVDISGGDFVVTGGSDPQENDVRTGDFDIVNDLPLAAPAWVTGLRVVGTGMGVTTLDGDASERIFDVHSGRLAVHDLSLVNGNLGGYAGYALHILAGASVVLDRCEISAHEGFVNGTAISSQGELKLARSWVHDNLAGNGSIWSAGLLTIDQCTFSANRANNWGAAVFASDSEVFITNSTFSNNVSNLTSTQGGGGAIAVINSSNLHLENCTVVGNRVELGSGGGGLYGEGWGHVYLHNTLFSANLLGSVGSTVASECVGDNVESLGHNLFSVIDGSQVTLALDGSDLTGSLATPLDVGLAALADNGGPTLTHMLEPQNSAAYNTGDNVGCPAIDQRGHARARTEADLCDIGAVEF